MKHYTDFLTEWIKRPVNFVCLLGIIALVPIFAYFAVKGWHVRYVGDDFCTAASVFEYGWWEAQSFWYQTWSGRFSFTAIVTALELLGEITAKLLPAITTLVWWVGMSWLVYAGFRFSKIKIGIVPSVLLAGALICMYVLTNTHPDQTFYWFTGNVTYTLPLVLLTFAAALGLKAFVRVVNSEKTIPLHSFLRSKNFIIVCSVGLLLFISASLNETHAMLQTLLLCIVGGMVLVWVGVQARLRLMLISVVIFWLLLTSVSGMIMYVAPGNDVRDERFPDNPTIEQTMEYSFNATNSYLLLDWQYAWFCYLAGLSFFVALDWYKDKKRRLTHEKVLGVLHQSLFISVVAYLLLVVVQFPSYYVQHYPTEERTLASFALTLGIAALLLGVQAARIVGPYLDIELLKRHNTMIVAGLGLLIIGVIFKTQSLYVYAQLQQSLPELQRYSTAWDRQYDRVRVEAAAGEENIVVGRLGHTFGAEDTTTNPEHWINMCMADYYNVETIVSE